MKKILLATTALVLSAAVADAQAVRIGGYAYMGVTSTGGTTTFTHAGRLNFTAAVEADHGLAFSMFSRNNIAPGGAWTSDRLWVRVSASGLTFTVGNTNGAVRALARTLAYYGYDDGGFAAAETAPGTIFQNDGNAAFSQNALLQYRIGDLSVAASTSLASAGRVSEVAAAYTVNAITVAAGISSAAGNPWALRAAYNGGDWNVALGHNSAGTTALVGSYTMGAITVGAAGMRQTAGNTYGLNVGYNLGGGATASATFGRNSAGVSSVRAGVIFTF
jgi:outer membrane protein OmpU